ncbi:MAG TPA: hypothetical protein VM370_00820 [Candidatus Thermoplasmatota archaeon]|nr:hypothetical protein [Candidatus Thermoplasmatota archaeon]
MHDVLEARCPSCGFSMKGLADTHGLPEPSCPFCGIVFSVRTNLSISRRLPVGMGLLMGAFVASIDASPLMASESTPIPALARMHAIPR